MQSTKKIQQERKTDSLDLANDTISESFVNSSSAWINMLLLSASGPHKPIVAQCATSIVSVDVAFDTLISGKAKLMICGGADDTSIENATELSVLGATCNSDKEMLAGREPFEQSRPGTTTRNGFTEANGAGIQLLTTASMALKMGLPIFAIIAGTHTAADCQGRSLSAPGKGLLAVSSENKAQMSLYQNNIFDLKWRRDQFDQEFIQLQKEYTSNSPIQRWKFKNKLNNLRKMYGYQLFESSGASALRCQLGSFGLSLNDIKVVSCHGTSTKANDINETTVTNTQMDSLDRKLGDPLFTVWQKYLTGHPKGASGACMLNGCIQMLKDNTIPGNRNADDFDPAMNTLLHLAHINETIVLPDCFKLKAILVNSFGFGQANAQTIILNPNIIFHCISQNQYSKYRELIQQRYYYSYQHINMWRCGEIDIVKIHNTPPYDNLHATQFLLQRESRYLGDVHNEIALPVLNNDSAEDLLFSEMLQTMQHVNQS